MNSAFRTKNNRKGLTLTETMIASALLLILIFAATTLLFQTFKNFSKMSREGDSLKNARGVSYDLSVILREVYELQQLIYGKDKKPSLVRFNGELTLTPGKEEIIIYPMAADMYGDKNVMFIDAEKNLLIREYKGDNPAQKFIGYPVTVSPLKERVLERNVNKVKFTRDVSDDSSGSLITIEVEAQSDKKEPPAAEIPTKALLHIK